LEVYELFVDLRNIRRFMEKLTAQEEAAMLSIWKTGEGHLKSFLDNMGDPKPPYTTLASTVKNLEKKGFLLGTLIGNSYVYKPLVTEEEYKKKFMSSFVKDYFDNSYKELVNFFVEQKKLSALELRDIMEMIERENR
jgi:BlaI family transcriptional regulator, penicillinase repressor